MRVLVIEDYGPLRRSIRKGLTEAGFAVDAAEDGQEGLEFLDGASYDIVVLDLMLPRMPGLAVLKRLRAKGDPAAVLILSARSGLEDRVVSLNEGADDYLTKPFAFEELLARVQAMTRRRYECRSPRIVVGDFELDTSARTAVRGGRRLELTAREYAILEFLAFRRGKIVSREEIWDGVADLAAEAGSNVIDVYVARLRRQLESDGGSRLIITRRGIGYCFGGAELER